jgi:hypothetical protein
MILLQAVTVGFIGYSIGTGLAAFFFELASRNLAMRGIVLLWQNVAGVGLLMFLVVIGASLLSIRRVLVLEPAAEIAGSMRHPSLRLTTSARFTSASTHRSVHARARSRLFD